jgi:hypothetical protein
MVLLQNIYLVDGDALLAPMSKASQDDTLKALTNWLLQLNTQVLITSTTPYSYQLEKRFKPKFNLGCRCFSYSV